MRRLVRWQYVLPRVALLIALWTGFQFALGRVVRSTIVHTGQRLVGASVEVADARVSLVPSQVVLSDLRVADPRRPSQNLLQAEQCTFDIDAESLLHRRVLINRGEISGVRLGTSRGADGPLPTPSTEPAAIIGWIDNQAAELANQWLEHLEKHFRRDFVNELESVRLAEELATRWPQQYADLTERVRQLRQRAVELQTHVDEAQSNPLRNASFLREFPQLAADLQEQFGQLAAEVEDLPETVETDRRAIIAARRHDEQLLREKLQIRRIDQEVLTAYLLREQVAGPASELIGWLRWARQAMPADPEPAPSNRQRGTDILFAGVERLPEFWIRSLAIRGTAKFGSQPVQLSGMVSDVSNNAALVDRPMTVTICTGGSLPLVLEATFDRRGTVAKDQLTLDCQGLVLPPVQLGHSDRLQIASARGVASVRMRVSLEGESLTGTVQLVQKQAQLTPTTSGKLAQLPLAEALHEAIRNVDTMEVRLSLAGTLQEPQWKLDSNLGAAVAQAIDGALEQTVEFRTQQQLARSERQVDEQLAQLDRAIADAQAVLQPQLAGSTRLLEQTVRRQQPAERLAPERLGRRLPAGSLFQ